MPGTYGSVETADATEAEEFETLLGGPEGALVSPVLPSRSAGHPPPIRRCRLLGAMWGLLLVVFVVTLAPARLPRRRVVLDKAAMYGHSGKAAALEGNPVVLRPPSTVRDVKGSVVLEAGTPRVRHNRGEHTKPIMPKQEPPSSDEVPDAALHAADGEEELGQDYEPQSLRKRGEAARDRTPVGASAFADDQDRGDD
jgi:hypothetical protein